MKSGEGLAHVDLATTPPTKRSYLVTIVPHLPQLAASLAKSAAVIEHLYDY